MLFYKSECLWSSGLCNAVLGSPPRVCNRKPPSSITDTLCVCLILRCVVILVTNQFISFDQNRRESHSKTLDHLMTEICGDTGFRQLSQFLLSIIFFHTSEYILAIAIHGASNVTLSSLLISKHYALAMLVAVVEYLSEIILFPELKQHMWISNFGLIMIVLGEIIRKTAIITAGRSFTHLIKINNHEDHHKLVTYGVYRLMRHPSYCGFLIWSVGTQVMLCNPVSTVLFTVVVWRFFAQRIVYEEHFLKQFFGVQYIEYAESVASGVPFVK